MSSRSIVRAPDDSHMRQLKEAGATEVIPEVLEGSLMIAAETLADSVAVGRPEAGARRADVELASGRVGIGLRRREPDAAVGRA